MIKEISYGYYDANKPSDGPGIKKKDDSFVFIHDKEQKARNRSAWDVEWTVASDPKTSILRVLQSNTLSPTSYINQWTEAKFELDLNLRMTKPHTKYQMNICKHLGKKCRKLIIHEIFLSPRAVTSWKINGPRPNSNLICNLVSQSYVPNITWISAST